MADEQDSPNDVGENGDAPEVADYDDHSTAIIANSTTPFVDDYVDEPIEDYVVNMVVNEQPDGVSLSPDFVNAAITDIHGNVIGTGLRDSINGYTTAIYDELNANGTAITGGKRWWGWSTKNVILFGLLALCILGIILGIVFLVIGKKFNKNKRSTAAGPITTTKAVVTKGVSPESKYHPVPNV